MAIRRLKKELEICIPFKLKSDEDGWIREMRIGDLEAVHEIECLVFEDPWSFSSFQHEITRSAVSWPLVAEIKTELVGYAVAWFVADEMHLANIAVSPLYLRHGIASQLLVVLLDESIRQEVGRAYLEVRPSNSAAIKLYEAFGFEKIGIRRRYYRNGEDAIVMQRFLPQQLPTFGRAILSRR